MVIAWTVSYDHRHLMEWQNLSHFHVVHEKECQMLRGASSYLYKLHKRLQLDGDNMPIRCWMATHGHSTICTNFLHRQKSAHQDLVDYSVWWSQNTILFLMLLCIENVWFPVAAQGHMPIKSIQISPVLAMLDIWCPCRGRRCAWPIYQ